MFCKKCSKLKENCLLCPKCPFNNKMIHTVKLKEANRHTKIFLHNLKFSCSFSLDDSNIDKDYGKCKQFLMNYNEAINHICVYQHYECINDCFSK